MNKQILCCIPWTEYCDYPLCRKLIKEKLSKCMTEIRVIIPSGPHGIKLSQEAVDEFYNWLSEDLRGYAIVERSVIDHTVTTTTKWSGNTNDRNYNPLYAYQFEYCVDQCNYDYVARIETDFVTKDWDKFEKALEEDFDVITVGIGKTHRSAGDVSFFACKRSLLLNIQDMIFTMVKQRKIWYSYHNNTEELRTSGPDYILLDKAKMLQKSDEEFLYDIFQWCVFRCIEQSDKTYLINPITVNFDHYVGMTQHYFMYRRLKSPDQTPQASDGLNHPQSPWMKYIHYMRDEIDLNNYNLFPPYKTLLDNYCIEYGTN